MKNQRPKKEWARLYGDSSEENFERITKDLRKLGFRVITFPNPHMIEPKLQIGQNVYHGDEIKKFIEKNE